MKLIEPNVQEITDFEGVDNFYKAVARAARICYAKEMLTDEQAQYLLQQGEITLSESIKNIASIGNDKALCERLIKSGHLSPFEHAIINFDFEKIYKIYTGEGDSNKIQELIIARCGNSKYRVETESSVYINGRVLVESIIQIKEEQKIINSIIELLDLMLDYLKELNSTNSIFKSYIVDTSIGCTREMNRHHDNFYIVEQSTRYCNFSKDKFGNEVAFNKPYWYDTASKNKRDAWEFAMRQAEYNYINNQYNFTVDEIRGILPLDTHTRAIYTATLEEWQHIIDLRLKGTTGKPHGDIMIIADKIDKLINNK